MFSGWVKYFADNTREVGSDKAIDARLASWRNGRLNGMVGAMIAYSGFTLKITGLGVYWQSDTIEAVWPITGTSVTKRRISKLIEARDTTVRYRIRDDSMTAVFNGELEEGKCIIIPKQWLHKWFVLEYNVKTGKPGFYVSDAQV